MLIFFIFFPLGRHYRRLAIGAVVPLQEQLDGAFVSHGREVSLSAISLSDHLSEGIPVGGALIVAVGDLGMLVE